jgi:hypothetical protein
LASTEPAAASESGPARVPFLEDGLFLLYHTLNATPSRPEPAAELLYYDEAIAARHGEPLDLGRVVQLMLFVDQAFVHRAGAHGIDGTLIVRAGGKKSFLARRQIEKLAEAQASSPRLSAPQLASMALALYTNRTGAEAVQPVAARFPDPCDAAAALLFIDLADGALDARLQAEGQPQLAELFQRSGSRPVVPFHNKRGLGSWVTPRQFIQPLQVGDLLSRSGVAGKRGSEEKRVRRLMRSLSAALTAVPDEDPDDPRKPRADLWSYPEETLRKRSGDCEDLSFVVQSCLEALHIRSRLVFGFVWDSKQRCWLGHVWVEWQDRILDLAYRGGRGSAIWDLRDGPAVYRAMLWFESERYGLADGWQGIEALGAGPAEAAAHPAPDEAEELLAGRGLRLPRSGARPGLLASRAWLP